jgi:cytochrome c oxidase cbb3-type subunit III
VADTQGTPGGDDYETTGHEWDGIAEYNKPLPRWWVTVLYASIVWAFGYWIVMPAWPLASSFTTGLLGYSQRTTVTNQIAEAEAARAAQAEQLQTMELEAVQANPDLLRFATAGGRSAFLVNCSQCHGTGGAGAVGYPNLIDDDWLWGGTLSDIHDTIRYGVRSTHDETRLSEMPAFGADEMLEPAEIADVAQYVLSLSGKATDTAAAGRGEETFVEWCAMCHGDDGTGLAPMGAPNLTDAIWLYGGDVETITKTISDSRRGVMPAWSGRLSDIAVKQLALYIHSLGGGE